MLMSVPSFIRIERGSDGGHVLKLNKGLLFVQIPVNINVSRSAAPKLALVQASRYMCDDKVVIQYCPCQVSLGLKEVQMGPMSSNLIRGFYLCKKGKYQCLRSAARKLDLMPASLYNYGVR